MKRSSWLLIVILAVACDVGDEPKDPVVKVTDITAFLGEYQGIRTIECGAAYDGSVCETLVQDQVLLVTKGPSDSTISILGYEVHVDKDGNLICCPDLENGSPIGVTIQNDTIKTIRGVRRSHGIYDTERFIGVKGAKSPLKAGSVGFRSTSSEELENIGTALIYVDIEGAKFGASIIIEILNPSTPDPSGNYDYAIYGGDAKIISDNKIVINVLPNVTSATVGLFLASDFEPNPSRNIQFRISDESVGINVSEKRDHSFTIVEDDIAEPSVSKIIFTGQSSNLFDINSDGTGLRQRNISTGLEPSFSPDGNNMVFISRSEVGWEWEIHTMNFTGLDLQRLTQNNKTEYSPSFSPQGDKILFVKNLRDSPEDNQIFTMNLDGTGETQLSHIDNSEGVSILGASWSPDGNQIVYSCNKGNEGFGHRIYVMNADGSNTRRLTDKFRSEERPRFSPDGQKIIFNTIDAGMIVSYLSLINSDGTGEEKLFSGITGLVHSEDAAWSPDSSTIVFWAEIEGNPALTSGTYTARIDGTDFRKITDERMLNPSWSPAK